VLFVIISLKMGTEWSSFDIGGINWMSDEGLGIHGQLDSHF
jgi:hypothetical protein